MPEGALRVVDADPTGRAVRRLVVGGPKRRRNGSAGCDRTGELAAEAEFDVTIVNQNGSTAAAEELVALSCSEVADPLATPAQRPPLYLQ
jgi:hypothetical protein